MRRRNANLAVSVQFRVPPQRQFPVGLAEHVDERDEVPVVLVALERRRVASDLGYHVLERRVAVV